jgi:serine/threonine protein kinase
LPDYFFYNYISRRRESDIKNLLPGIEYPVNPVILSEKIFTQMTENKDKEILFGRFRIEECLQKDRVSNVYVAWHIFLDKKILLKTLHAAEIDDPTWLERFRREAKVLARLDHPNIIRVLDFGSEKDIYYISFEYFEARDLRYILQHRKLQPDQKQSIFIQLLHGLHAAHQQGIIHRDIKPENILVSEKLQVKLADFGLAFPADESKLTRKSSLVGTPAYMSPEQIRGEHLDRKTDLFSAGLVAFEMYCGYHPFLGPDAKQTINHILSFDHQEITGNLGDKQPAVIADMLDPSRDRRPGSAAEVLDKMGIGPEYLQMTLPAKKNKRPRVLFAVLGVIIVLVFSGSYLYFFKPAPPIMTASNVEAKPRSADSILNAITERPAKTEPEHRVQEAVQTNQTARDKTKSSAEVPQTSGQIFLFSDPPSNVYIDQQFRGKTPFQKPLELAAGTYQLVLSHNHFPDFLDTISVHSGQTQVLSYALDTLFGYLSCQIYPWGMILIDGRLVGETPLPEVLPLVPGKHLLTIENPAYQVLIDSLDITQQETTFYQINLEKKSEKF